MSDLPEPHAPPETWSLFRRRATHWWTIPFVYVDWLLSCLAWRLSRWSLFHVLKYAETFSVLIALIFWIAETRERRQQKHYQAWQVINTAQGKGGSGGRGDAMEQLNSDHVPLIGVDAAEAFLQDVQLDKAELRRATFRASDLRRAHLRAANLQDTVLNFANLRAADLRSADCTEASMADADLNQANLRLTNVQAVVLDRADLRGADLQGLKNWQSIASIQLANIADIQNAPEGFVTWATGAGAVQFTSTEKWNAALKAAEDARGK